MDIVSEWYSVDVSLCQIRDRVSMLKQGILRVTFREDLQESFCQNVS